MTIMDLKATLADAQTVTATAATTDYYDSQAAAADMGAGEPLWIVFRVDTTADAVGAGTVTFSLETDDNTGFSTPTTLLSSAAIGKATLVAGYLYRIMIPPGCERYVQGRYTVATGPLTAGKFDCYIVRDARVEPATPFPRATYPVA